MYFDNHKYFTNARINKDLFWEYDMEHFDFQKQVDLVVQRVVQRGTSEDFYAMLNLYGFDLVKEAIKRFPTFSQREMEFINNVLGIPYSELTAYLKMKESPSKWPNNGTPIRI
ncbi:MAG: DUF6922 domain-containing protein [Cyclobacteriaceae bacterium]|jgi:hypothetical protein